MDYLRTLNRLYHIISLHFLYKTKMNISAKGN
mgnify:CR=1 FL=1